MLKKVCSYLLIAFVVAVSCAFSALTDDIEVGKQFQKKGSSVYLECKWKHPDHPTTFKRSFFIKRFGLSGQALPEDNIVGSIGIVIEGRSLSIGQIDIYQGHLRKGYATWAIQTFLSVYRSEKRASLPFERFSLEVALRNRAAIGLYEKVGFSTDPADGSVPEGWQSMSLKR